MSSEGSANGANGLNGHGINGLSSSQWKVGLINSKQKYLTAETFGFKVNVTGNSLKKKQVWYLEPNANVNTVFLKSHLGRFISVDTYGNVTCESENKGEAEKFTIVVAEDASGRWAFKNGLTGYYFAGNGDKLTCSSKSVSETELWIVHLAVHPQVNIRSVGRKRYARLCDDEIRIDQDIPWGQDALITLEYRNGRYAVKTCNNKYLSSEGKLVENTGDNTLYTLVFHAGQLAIKDFTGKYLSPIGSVAALKSKNKTVSKDEQFILEDSHPQMNLVACNGKKVSIRQGFDVRANQDEVTDHETFQLEYDKDNKGWQIRTVKDKYWSLERGGGIQANADQSNNATLFNLDFQDDGSVVLKANNDKYITAKKNGQLYATSDSVDTTEKFRLILINRPILVLKGNYGFVGYKSAAVPKIECNRTLHDIITVEHSDSGVMHFKGGNNKYWRVAEDKSVIADSDEPEPFIAELREQSRLCLKTSNGSYIIGEQNGLFRATGDANSATLWEY